MSKIAILTDSGSDILQYPELHARGDVRIIYLTVNIGTEEYTDETLSLDQLLEKMNNATKETWPATSQPSVGHFQQVYEELKDEGFTDVVSIHVAEKMSGTINSARLGSESVDDLNVHIVDSQLASTGITQTVLKAVELLDAGKSAEEIASECASYADDNELYIAVPRLDNLYKGGRLKPIRYRLGKLLKFKPILRMAHGAMDSHDKTRDISKTQQAAYDYALEPFTKEDDFMFMISHAWVEDRAKEFAEKFKKDYPDHEVHVGRVGPSMAVHLGPEGLVFSVYRK